MKPRIFVADRIHSFHPAPPASAMLVEAGRVRALGSARELTARAPAAELIDLTGTTITPGLTDAHIHLTEWSVARAQVDLARESSVEAAAQAAAAATRNQGWVLGRGWNPHLWGGAYPQRAALDAHLPDTPVVLQSHDMHALWLNSAALARCGISNATADPPGGRILRDDAGEPTGVLLENAAQLIVPFLPQYDLSAIVPLVYAAQHQLHRWGITAVHSYPGIHIKDPQPRAVVKHMHERGSLRLRVLTHIALDDLDTAIENGERSGRGDDWLRTGSIKMFLDGALGSRTAWMHDAYEDSTSCGVQVMAADEFQAAVARAAAHGLASTVHAIGDAAVDLAFRVLADPAVAVAAMPHRIEHVQCLPAGLSIEPRVICSVQPSHLMTDWRAADVHWGGRAARTYAFRTLLDAGATLAFGSDAPVESADPRHGLYAAMARSDLAGQPAGGWHQAQALSPEEAFAGYILGPARAAGATGPVGLAPGALADFVAWQQDPLGISPVECLTLEARATVVAGDIVFEQ